MSRNDTTPREGSGCGPSGARPADVILEEWREAARLLNARRAEADAATVDSAAEERPLTSSGRFIKPPLGDDAAEAMEDLRASEDRRQMLAPLVRTLVQKRELGPKGLFGVLRLALDKVNGALSTEASFVLLLDRHLKQADVLCAGLPRRQSFPPPRKRLLRRLEEAPLPFARLGVLPQVNEAQLFDCLAPGEAPESLVEVLSSRRFASMIAVPTTVSQRLTSLLVVVNPTEPFGEEDLLRLQEVAGYERRVVQRALGLSPELGEEEQARCFALLSGTEYAAHVASDRELLSVVGPKPVLRYGVLPLRRAGARGIAAAVVHPLDVARIHDFELSTGLAVKERVTTTESALRSALALVFPDAAQPVGAGRRIAPRGDLMAQIAGDLRGLPEISEHRLVEEVGKSSSPLVRLTHQLIEDAYLRGASDIHVETLAERVVIRYRVDGVCRERLSLPRAASRALVARLKIMSDLDIAERRLPQDGRIDFTRFNDQLPIDLRVSVLPMKHGEWVCMRILEKKRSTMPLEELGFSPENLRDYRQAIRAPCGMILHCGPTGSGKSMTLYAALNEIKGPELKVVTAEDPVEYVLDGIGQLQIHPKIGLDFPRALRSFLRHDPDIILVGEIRDAETARIAVEASLTGHLLLSTLHTNDAAGSVARLEKLGIEPYLVAGTLIAVCAQRLVRKLCHCKRHKAPSPQERGYLKRAADSEPIRGLWEPVGCEHCHHVGYRGRTGIHELLRVSTRLRQHISEGASSEAIKMAARNEGMHTLFADAASKVKAGVTSLAEALRVSTPDDFA